jgi:hypothetical protein
MSRQPLLRYATQNQIEKAARGGDRVQQLRASVDEMISEMNIGYAMRAAGLGDDQVRPGCEGLLAKRGREATPPVSAP